MLEKSRLLVEKQVDRVRRRLFIQVILQSALPCWAIGLLVATLWFLARPFAFAGFDDAGRWLVPVGVLGVSTCAGIVLAWLRRPSRVMSSLALDERFNLKERVTTLLTLSDQQLETPAGQALLRDVAAHLANLKVSAAFPLRLSLKQALMPVGALALAALACVLDPILGDLRFSPRVHADAPRQREIDTEQIQQRLDEIKKAVAQRREEQPKSLALKDLEIEFDKLINKPFDGKSEDKVRERINEFRKLEDKLKERMDGFKEKREKIDAFKKHLQELGLDKNKLQKDGPAKDFEEALMNGNLNKARAALEKLIKDMKNDKLTKEQEKQLAEQFKELHEKLQKLLENDEKFREQIRKQLADGKIDAEQFRREMERLQDLQDLADVIGDARDALEMEGAREAGEQLDKLKSHFEQIELTEQEIRELIRDQDEIQEALRLLGDALDDDGEDDGMGGGRRAGTHRPIDPDDPASKIRREKQKAEVDAKGIQRVTGHARGGTFSRIPAKAVEGAFRQAVQEAPEALDRQRIPDDARDISRGYFEKLGNQK